jgi:hypothetical protein
MPWTSAVIVEVRSSELRVPTRLRESLKATLLQTEPKERRPLLLGRKSAAKPQLDRFLCGHDEREWFIAAVPGGVSSVRQAIGRARAEPRSIEKALLAQDRRISRAERIFVPKAMSHLEQKLVLRNEPLRPGAGKKTQNLNQ